MPLPYDPENDDRDLLALHPADPDNYDDQDEDGYYEDEDGVFHLPDEDEDEYEDDDDIDEDEETDEDIEEDEDEDY